jgi:hypothetical protein
MTEQLKPSANLHVINGPRIIKACHTCKHEDRQNSDDRDDFWCLASGKPLEETLENESWCGADYDWWEPRPAEPETPKAVPAFDRLKRWLVG